MNRMSLKEIRIGRKALFPTLLALGVLLVVIPPSPTACTAQSAVGNAPGSLTLSLDEARSLALASDEQLAQVEQSIAGAWADVMSARSGRLPQLSLGGTWTRNLKKPVFFLPPDMAAGLGGATSVEMGGDWDLQAAATLSYNLWTAGRLSAAQGMAREALSAVRWQEALVTDAVVFTVEAAYLDALLAAEQVEIAAGALALAREYLRVTEAAYEEGTTSRFDLLRAQVEHTNREAPLVQARNDLNLKTLTLLRVCGLDADTRIELTDTFQAASAPAPLSDLMTRMHDGSPELQALQHSVRAANLQVNLARAGRGPMVQLQGQYIIQGQWDDDIFPESKESVGSATAALIVSLPIFDGFSAKAEILGSRADLRIAQLELDRVTRDRELGVRQARTYLENALIALEGRREGVALAEEAYHLAQIRLDNGLATPVERLDAELALTEARVQLAQALYSCNIANSNLKLAVGGTTAAAALDEETNR
jgi:outer membrane protein